LAILNSAAVLEPEWFRLRPAATMNADSWENKQMTRTSTLLIALALVVNFALPAWAGDDMEAIKQQIADSWDKLHSIKAKLTTTTYWVDDDGPTLKAERTGTYEHLKHKRLNMFRMEHDGNALVPMGPGKAPNVIKRKMLMIKDGRYEYMLNETLDSSEAMKWSFSPKRSPDPRTLLKTLAEASNLVLKGQEESDGKKVYVIESVPKAERQRVSRVVYRFREDGIMLKQETYNRDDKVTFVMELSEVETNVDIAPERFVFKPPPGVEVEELTS